VTDHRELAARFGTPLYVYDLDDVAAVHVALRAALPDPCELFYAFKANPHPDVARALREGAGPACGAEISSTGELAAAREAGYPTASCLYTGPGKTRAELAEAVSEVIDVKHSRGQTFVVLDAGINAFGGLSGLGRLLPTAVRPVGGGGGTVVATLTGPLCTPGDLLDRDLTLPEPAVGDVLTIPNAGAYGLTASLVRFLGRRAPAEVALRGGTVVSVSRVEHRAGDLQARPRAANGRKIITVSPYATGSGPHRCGK
jgi:diaminopimelate decarboxylase